MYLNTRKSLLCVYIHIYKNNPNTLSIFSKNKMNDSTITCADTKKASILLIRKIYVLMQNLSPLPNDVCLTMKLFYYDEGSISILPWFINCVQTLENKLNKYFNV